MINHPKLNRKVGFILKGSVYRVGCTCKLTKCKCGAKWGYTVDVDPDPRTGKRRQKSKSTFKTKKEAEAAVAAVILELTQGLYVEESDITFGEFAAEWLKIYEDSKNVKPGTIRVRLHEMGVLLPYFEKLKMKNITRKMYQDALNVLKERGYADNTLSGINPCGRMIFRKALEMDLIKKDPTEFSYLKKDKKTVAQLEEEEIPKYLEKEELALFLKTAKEKGQGLAYLIFLILAYTGMRVGELVALKWKEIDFKNHTINITKTYYNPTSNTTKFMLLPPKTKKSKRKITVDEDVIEALRQHKENQDKLKKRLGEAYLDEGFIFAKTDRQFGYPIVVKTVQLKMKKLLELAGLNTELTPRSLRHTHTSLLAEAGVTLEQIMDRLGHSDDKTTKNVYLHVTQEAKKEASHKFAQLMKNLH